MKGSDAYEKHRKRYWESRARMVLYREIGALVLFGTSILFVLAVIVWVLVTAGVFPVLRVAGC